MPSDAQFITGSVPKEMREGIDLIPGVEVAPPTETLDVDGTPAQLTRVSFPRPTHIPPPPIPDPQGYLGGIDPKDFAPRHATLRYDFPLFPDVQVHVEFHGNANADHLEQLTELLNVQCRKLREQEARRVATPAPRKVKSKKVTPSNE